MSRRIQVVLAVVVAAVVGGALEPVAVAGADKLQQVFVTNDARSPIATKTVGEPVQGQVRLDADGSINFGRVIFTVPRGKQLEIEHVSFSDSGLGVPLRAVTLTVVQRGVSRQVFVPVHAVGSTAHAASEAVTAYADPLTEVFVSAHTEQPVAPGGGALWWSFSGVLTPA